MRASHGDCRSCRPRDGAHRLMTSSPQKFFLGVDGGNSKTVALISTADGRVIGAGRGPCADIYAPPSSDAAIAAVHTAVTAATRSASITSADIEAATFSMAGADWPEDFQFLHDAFTA